MYKQDIKEKVKERYGKIALLGNVPHRDHIILLIHFK
jgi:hypothetical protein